MSDAQRIELKNWMVENAEVITARVNEYTAACNIKISEFTGKQKQRLIIGLFAVEIAKMLK